MLEIQKKNRTIAWTSSFFNGLNGVENIENFFRFQHNFQWCRRTSWFKSLLFLVPSRGCAAMFSPVLKKAEEKCKKDEGGSESPPKRLCTVYSKYLAKLEGNKGLVQDINVYHVIFVEMF